MNGHEELCMQERRDGGWMCGWVKSVWNRVDDDINVDDAKVIEVDGIGVMHTGWKDGCVGE